MADRSATGSEDVGRRHAVATLSAHLPPPFLVLPPTNRFPHMVVAHGDYGLCAVVMHEGLVMYDEDGDRWYGTSHPIDPETMGAQAAMELAAAARAPQERVTALVWLVNGISHVETPESICAAPDPSLAARMAQSLVARRLVGTSEPVDPWLGAYAKAALGPAEQVPKGIRRLTQLIEHCLLVEFGDQPALIEGVEIPAHDLADPRFLLPALIVAAHEDWGVTRIASKGGRKPPGFDIVLQPDPGAFLGYRLEDVRPAHPFFVLNPIVAAARRYKFHSEYLLDDMLGQFGRYLLKNGFDATVVDTASAQIKSRQGEA